MAIIELIDVHKSFGPKKVLRGVSLEINKGENHVVVGRSGEGKSVLIKQIIGLMTPDSGQVFVGGHEMGKNPEALRWVRQKVAMVFQMAALFDSLTVYENIAFYWIENKKKTRKELDLLVPELLELVDLPNTAHLYPAELSGGMKKRVGLARALACDPEILLYDEPTTGLDPVTSEVINALMIRASHARNVTSVVITHDMKSAYEVGHRISMLYEGNIIFTGTPREVENCRNPVVYQFVNGLAEGPITQGEDEEVQRTSRILEKERLGVQPSEAQGEATG